MAATTAIVGATVAASAYSAKKSGDAAKDAAEAQTESSGKGIEEQRRQYDKMVELLSPYVNAGSTALNRQQGLLGLLGEAEQKAQIGAIEQSPYFQSTAQQGENAILQSASATGGLRGGNTQGALAQFRPQLLNQLVQQQYSNLGGITSLGQNSAAQTGNAGMQSASNIGNLFAQQGQAQAGGYIGAANATSQGINNLLQLGGAAYGAGAF